MMPWIVFENWVINKHKLDAAEHKASLSLSDNFAGVFKMHSIDCEEAFPLRNPNICFFLERQKSIISGRLLIIFESVE